MKAIEVTGSSESPKVTVNPSVPQPTPQGAEILIKVHAAGITADEVGWPELWERPIHIPGLDVSGTVAALGPDYAGALRAGDDVFAMLHGWRGQGQAEFAIAGEEEVARKPTSLSHAEASALPIPALTAWEGIFTHAKLGPGARLLVTGASGAVGRMIVQVAAKRAGAHVIALASARHHDALRALGASQVVDYNAPAWWTSIPPVDVVYDTVGDPVLAKTWHAVGKDGNGLVMTVGNPPAAWNYGKGRPEELDAYPDVRWLYFIVSAEGENLAKMAQLIDDGEMQTLPVIRFPIDRGAEAWEHAAKRNRTGKVVIEFVSE